MAIASIKIYRVGKNIVIIHQPCTPMLDLDPNQLSISCHDRFLQKHFIQSAVFIVPSKNVIYDAKSKDIGQYQRPKIINHMRQ